MACRSFFSLVPSQVGIPLYSKSLTCLALPCLTCLVYLSAMDLRTEGEREEKASAAGIMMQSPDMEC
jgi:hypothetical protein